MLNIYCFVAPEAGENEKKETFPKILMYYGNVATYRYNR